MTPLQGREIFRLLYIDLPTCLPLAVDCPVVVRYLVALQESTASTDQPALLGQQHILVSARLPLRRYPAHFHHEEGKPAKPGSNPSAIREEEQLYQADADKLGLSCDYADRFKWCFRQGQER